MWPRRSPWAPTPSPWASPPFWPSAATAAPTAHRPGELVDVEADYGALSTSSGHCAHCHTGRCPVGITTQDPSLESRLDSDHRRRISGELSARHNHGGHRRSPAPAVSPTSTISNQKIWPLLRSRPQRWPGCRWPGRIGSRAGPPTPGGELARVPIRRRRHRRSRRHRVEHGAGPGGAGGARRARAGPGHGRIRRVGQIKRHRALPLRHPVVGRHGLARAAGP